MLDLLTVPMAIPMDIIGSAKDTLNDVRGLLITAVGVVCIIVVLGVAWATKGAMGAIIKSGVACAIVFALCAGGIVALGNSTKDEIETRTKETGDALLRSQVVIPHTSGASHG